MTFPTKFEAALGKVLMLWSLKRPDVREDFEFYKNEILQRVGAKDASSLKQIGEGTNGYVFWLPNKKRILKLTRDQMDADASEVIHKKPNKNLIKVHDVFTFGLPYWKQSWGIVAEKLQPLSSSEEKSWSWIVQMGLGQYSKFGAPRLYELNPAYIDLVETWLSHDESKVFPGLVDALNKHLPTLKEWAQLFQQRGIGWGDLHLGNLMMRGKTPIIADVGGGAVAGQNIPELMRDEK